ncbi:MAG: GtrA family protein [Bacillota bacterium]|nr:GtrA family protein [Bacillota bacterium]
MKKYYEMYKEPILYVIFGALTTAVNYFSYIIFAHLAGLSVVFSNAAAWVLSVIFAFVTNKLLVFESKSLNAGSVIKELTSFVTCRLLSGLLDTGIMVLFIDVAHYNDLYVKLFSNVLVVIINYVLSKNFIFTRKEGAENG